MKKLIVFMIVIMFLFAPLAHAGSHFGSMGPVGPAPNSGDGIPDGSGFDDDDMPIGPVGPYMGIEPVGIGMTLMGIGIRPMGPVGPAPNSGDGIPDGSGF